MTVRLRRASTHSRAELMSHLHEQPARGGGRTVRISPASPRLGCSLPPPSPRVTEPRRGGRGHGGGRASRKASSPVEALSSAPSSAPLSPEQSLVVSELLRADESGFLSPSDLHARGSTRPLDGSMLVHIDSASTTSSDATARCAIALLVYSYAVRSVIYSTVHWLQPTVQARTNFLCYLQVV